MTKTVTARELRNQIGALVHQVNAEKEEVIITNHGRPRAVLMSFTTYEEIRLMLMQKRKVDALRQRESLLERVRAAKVNAL